MLLSLDNSDLLSLEFSLWFSSKGAIWPSFVVPNAILEVARGPALFVPDYQMWKSCPALAPPGIQEEKNFPATSPVF